jgi:hypothetical protein
MAGGSRNDVGLKPFTPEQLESFKKYSHFPQVLTMEQFMTNTKFNGVKSKFVEGTKICLSFGQKVSW